MRTSSGIYVEIEIQDDLDHVWLLTQDPVFHERWDLRFSRIHYLPRSSSAEPQQFLYETRIGFGLSIKGTGESIGQRASAVGDTTSSLKFASADPKSLIDEGSGYWRYVPTQSGLRFLTWYDYKVRFGIAGQFVDRLVFRPLMGWATAWSFDCSSVSGRRRVGLHESDPRILAHSCRRPTFHRHYLDLARSRAEAAVPTHR